jgi:hypothetical protein
MNMKKILASGTTVIATAGVMLANATGPAAAHDDTHKVSGSCSRSSDYTLTLADSGSQLRQQHLTYSIDGHRGKGRVWTVSVYKDGDRIYRTTKKTDSNGNITLNRTFTADDDADIKVYAKAGYGEHCSRTASLD